MAVSDQAEPPPAGDQAGAPGGNGAEQPAAGPVRRLRRAERREQILSAATRAFARHGFAATGLDDVAAEARISRVILYRHFDSKTDLYRAVLERARDALAATVGTGDYHAGTVGTLLRAASADPDGFRLLFRHAPREPEFRDFTDRLAVIAVDLTHQHLTPAHPDPRWAAWTGQLLPTVVIEAVIAWLDAGQPDPEQAAARIGALIGAIIEATASPADPG